MTNLIPTTATLDSTSADLVFLPIVETFHSVQGEGVWTGTNAFFIRLGGCDVCCPWCDTKQSWNARNHPQRNIADLIAEVQAAHPAIAIITGGEPLLHDLTPLSVGLQAKGLKVHLETSGAHPFSGSFDWVTFSPKQFKPPHESILSHVNELKVVITDARDLDWAEHYAAKLPVNVVRFLQPEWGTADSYSLIFKYVLDHPQWRISLQTHKFTNIR